MALPSTTVWEVRPGSGADTNGGGFVTGASGTDYSQLNSAQYSLTNGTATTSSATILTASASADMVGNIAYIAGGTGSITAAWYEIVSVSVGTSITVDRSTGLVTGTGVTITIGGALATIGKINTILTTANQNSVGQTVWVKATATITTATQIAFSPTGSATTFCWQISGYGSTRGDGGQVTIANSTGTSFVVFYSDPSALIIRNFIVNGNSKSGVTCFEIQGGNGVQLWNCYAENAGSSGYGFRSLNQNVVWNNCVATGCGGTAAFQFEAGNGSNFCIDCLAYANACHGFLGNGGVLIRCSAAYNTGTSHGFSLGASSASLTLDHCTSLGNGGDGLRLSGIDQGINIQSCIFYGNTGYAMNYTGATFVPGCIVSDYNAYGGNTAGELTGGFVAGPHDVALSVGSPFLSSFVVADMITLNNTVGAGAACRGAGFPGLLQYGQLGYSDIGALQSQGGATYVIQKNVTRIFVNEGD